ncbi:hypothetical protein CRYUN_Cryun29cG0047600 [Craigia yunnanensis]
MPDYTGRGYTVTTVIDGHKLKINSHSILARPASSDLLLFDSSNSHLYTVSFPLSNGTVTTIAGGYSKAIGKKDRPAQNATFSIHFEIAVVVERCILLVVEHGGQSYRVDSDLGVLKMSLELFGCGPFLPKSGTIYCLTYVLLVNIVVFDDQ